MRNVKIKNLKVGDIFLFPRSQDFQNQPKTMRDALRMFGKLKSKEKNLDKGFDHCWNLEYFDYDSEMIMVKTTSIARSHWIIIYSEEEADLLLLSK